jgi:hypothetical protein
MRLRARILGLGLVLGVLAGGLPGIVAPAAAMSTYTCTPVKNTVYIAWMYGPTVNKAWQYSTATLTAPVYTPDYKNFYVCGSVVYTGPAGPAGYSTDYWNINGTVVAFGQSTFGLDRYHVMFSTQIQWYGKVTYSAAVSSDLKIVERCKWGWTNGSYPYPCESTRSRIGAV